MYVKIDGVQFALTNLLNHFWFRREKMQIISLIFI
ncbi:hypothetical protein LCGC14_1438620 [marine sediment metagenome]|uniref:Uncharacterized protein n=1 Tax=marine sediment metagenome TaxID=412755 RepID=A0A0F9MN74_9ZZZZ